MGDRRVRPGFGWGALAGLLVIILLGDGGLNLGPLGFVLMPTYGLMGLLPDPARFKTTWIDLFELVVFFGSHILLYAYAGAWIGKRLSKRAHTKAIA